MARNKLFLSLFEFSLPFMKIDSIPDRTLSDFRFTCSYSINSYTEFRYITVIWPIY